MDIEYDADKVASNRAKHGVPLVPGAIVLENRIEQPDATALAYLRVIARAPKTVARALGRAAA